MANNSPWFIQRASRNGKPLPGAKLYAFVVNTTIPKPIYADVTLLDAHPTPLIADGDGLYPQYFLGSGEYTFIETDALDVQNGEPWNFVSATGGSSTPSPGSGGTFEILSITEGMTLIEDRDDLHWSPAGCFCWIVPAEGFAKVKYLKTVNPGGSPTPTRKFAIFGLPSSDAAGVKLYEGFTPMHFEALDLDVSSYPFVGVAMDPLPWGVPEPVKQTRLFTPEVTASGIANNFHYIGGHVHDTPFTTFPTIIANDPAYYFARWMALGVTCE